MESFHTRRFQLLAQAVGSEVVTRLRCDYSCGRTPWLHRPVHRGAVFKTVGEGGDAGQLAGLRDALMDIADREEQLWTALAGLDRGEGVTRTATRCSFTRPSSPRDFGAGRSPAHRCAPNDLAFKRVTGIDPRALIDECRSNQDSGVRSGGSQWHSRDAAGNLMATLSRARWQTQDLCQADLFRIEDGKIVEHWDRSEPVFPEDE